MNAMILKELRENGKWALLGAVGMTIALFAALSSTRHVDSLASETFQMTTQFGFAALAVLLAAGQTVPEQWRDRWSFLVHRPVTRTRIFFAKFATGVALYVLACGVSLLIVYLWGSSTGRRAAPVLPEMLQPALAELVGGLAWYAAAMLVCTRRARWIGSRIMPLGVPLVATGMVYAVAENLAQAVVIHLVTLALLLPAAWGAFVAGGTYEPLPRGAKLAQLFAVVCGMSLAVASAGVVVMSGLAICFMDAQRGSSTSTNYMLMRDGRIVRTTWHDPTRGSTTVTTVDLDGKPIPELSSPQLEDLNIYKHAVSFLPIATTGDDVPGLAQPEARSLMLHSPRRYVQQIAWDTPNISWYYLPTRGWIEGYSPRGQRVARMGAGGFVGPDQQPQRFDGPLHESHFDQGRAQLVLADRNNVYRVAPRERRIEKIYTPPPGETITAAMHFTMSYANENAPNDALFIATPARIHVIPPPGTPAKPFDIALEGKASERNGVVVTVVYLRDSGETVVWYQPTWTASSPKPTQPHRFVTYDRSGSVSKDVTLPPLNGFEFAKSPRMTELPMYAAVSLADVAFASVFAWLLGNNVANAFRTTVPTIVVLIVAGMALLSAAAAYWLARRHALAQPRRLLWAAGGAVFALPGVLTLLSVPEMPARVPCPNCGRRRIVTRDTCEHCAAPFPPPASDGTEIFE